jgi:hypothetical protein
VIFTLIGFMLLSFCLNLPNTSGRNTSTSSPGSNVYGDFNNDGYDDLAIGAPYEGIGTTGSAGAVNILYGSSDGLSSVGDQMWHQNTPGILGICETDDRFGTTLSVGDFDNDGYDDLAIGVPYESFGTASWAGAVNVLYGSSSGLSSTARALICQRNDYFGKGVSSVN